MGVICVSITAPAAYGWAQVLVAAVGVAAALGGLWWAVKYVKATVRIAEATELQGKVLSAPAVAVRILPLDPLNNALPIGGVYVEISNHASVHAKMRLKLWTEIRDPNTQQVRTVEAPKPYDGSVWPLFARQEFTGHFRFSSLSDQPGQTMRLIGRLDYSPYDREEYRRAPQILYEWSLLKPANVPGWMPCPPEE